jgi:hypothetical protein
MSVGRVYRHDKLEVFIRLHAFNTHALNSEANLGRAVATMV